MSKSTELISPCISVCEINSDTGFCKGCWRTRREISDWQNCSTEARSEILKCLRKRKRESGLPEPRMNRRWLKK